MARQFVKGGKLRQITKRNTEPAEPAGTETPFDEPQASPTGSAAPEAPVPTPKEKKTPKTLSFFERLQRIDPKDWGTRAEIKVYRLAPIINRLMSSEHRYITIYEEPVTEQKIKLDHGSGRYRLYLNYKAPAGSEQKEIDRVEIDILDPKFPPNVPSHEWMDDPKNKQWAWAKPAGASGPNYPAFGYQQPQQQQQTPLAEVAEVLRVSNEIRKEAREELKQNAPPTQPAAATQSSTLSEGFALAKELLTMKADNPMVDLMKEEITAMRKQVEDSRNEIHRLQTESTQAQIKALEARISQQDKPKTLIEQATELSLAAEKLKGLFGVGGGTDGAAAPTMKSKMSGWMELISDVGPTVLNSPIMNALAAKLAGPALAPPTVNLTPQPQNGAQPANPQQDLFGFVNNTVTPALIEYLQTGNTGDLFAEWMFNGYPERLQELQQITYPAFPGLKGAPVILELYKHSPAWAQLQRFEAKLPQFIEQFCAWENKEEEDEDPGNQTIDVKPEPSSDPDNRGGDF